MTGLFKRNESKGIFISLLIHTTLLGAILIQKDETVKVADKQKTVSIDLACMSIPKQNSDNSPQKPLPKNQEKKKETVKPKEENNKNTKPVKEVKKHKPLLKEKTKEKAEKPEEKKVLKKVEEKPLEKKEPSKKKDKKIKPEKTVQRESKEKTKPVKEAKPLKQGTLNTARAQQQSFVKTNFAVIRDMVLENLKYPSIAKRMGWSGTVKIKIVINISGQVESYEIMGSSAKKALDNAALKAVESIINKKLPKPKSKTTIILPVRFKLN